MVPGLVFLARDDSGKVGMLFLPQAGFREGRGSIQ